MNISRSLQLDKHCVCYYSHLCFTIHIHVLYFRFYIKCDDGSKLYLSTSALVADKVSFSPFFSVFWSHLQFILVVLAVGK